LTLLAQNILGIGLPAYSTAAATNTTTTNTTTLILRLLSDFNLTIFFQVITPGYRSDPREISQRRPVWDCRCEFFYSPDALAVIQTNSVKAQFLTHSTHLSQHLCICTLFVSFADFIYYSNCTSFAIRLSGRKVAIKLID